MSSPITLAAVVALGAILTSVPAEAENSFCPPGLAKKEVACVPPGQAKKLHGWDQGDHVWGDYVLIPRADWVSLQLRDYGDGSTYLRVDNQILRVARDTLTVIEAVRIIERALD